MAEIPALPCFWRHQVASRIENSAALNRTEWPKARRSACMVEAAANRSAMNSRNARSLPSTRKEGRLTVRSDFVAADFVGVLFLAARLLVPCMTESYASRRGQAQHRVNALRKKAGLLYSPIYTMNGSYLP